MEAQPMDQGVTAQEGAEAPESAPEESQPSEQGEIEETEQSASQDEEVLPFGKHPRWIQQMKANREMKTQLKQFQEQLQAYEPIKQLDQYLAANPQKAEQIRRILEAKEAAAEAAQDPYEGFSPEVAERFRKLDALEQWKQQLEQTEQQRAQEAITTHQNMIDESYYQLLAKDGFLDKEGKPIDSIQVNAMNMVTKSFLDEVAKDPSRPSVAEMKEAYSLSQKVFSRFGKQALKNAVKQPHVPSSGSRSGAAYAPKAAPRTAEQRQAEILRSLG